MRRHSARHGTVPACHGPARGTPLRLRRTHERPAGAGARHVPRRPTAGRLFTKSSADVVQVERPRSGDELRAWRRGAGDTSLLFRALARGTRFGHRRPAPPRGPRPGAAPGRALRPGAREVPAWHPRAARARPGRTAEGPPGPGPGALSGYGQTGPYRDHPGFASAAEAMGGLRALTSDPNRPAVRVGLSLGGTLAGLYAAIRGLMALLQRERTSGAGGTPGPETVDVALYEAVSSVLEDHVSEHDGYGAVREGTVVSLPKIVPSRTYPCRDGSWVVIGGKGEAFFRRITTAVERRDLAEDPALGGNAGCVAHRGLIDKAVAAWTRTRRPDEVAKALEAAGVPHRAHLHHLGQPRRPALRRPRHARPSRRRGRTWPPPRGGLLRRGAQARGAHRQHLRYGSGAWRAHRRGVRGAARPRRGRAPTVPRRRGALTLQARRGTPGYGNVPARGSSAGMPCSSCSTRNADAGRSAARSGRYDVRDDVDLVHARGQRPVQVSPAEHEPGVRHPVDTGRPRHDGLGVRHRRDEPGGRRTPPRSGAERRRPGTASTRPRRLG